MGANAPVTPFSTVARSTVNSRPASAGTNHSRWMRSFAMVKLNFVPSTGTGTTKPMRPLLCRLAWKRGHQVQLAVAVHVGGLRDTAHGVVGVEREPGNGHAGGAEGTNVVRLIADQNVLQSVTVEVG